MPGHSTALAIILLTVIIRLILLPSSLKAARLQVKNLELQPKINKLRAEIKDPKEQSQALMQLYKDENVSPFGSCLPLLIQMPVLIVLYQVFRSGLSASGYSGLYHFVSRPSSINTMFMGLDLSKPNPWVLPIVAAVLQYFLSKMMMPPKPKTETDQNDPAAIMSKQMMYMLPLFTLVAGRAMPAALVIYWIITTVFSIGQQSYVNREIKSQSSSVSARASLDGNIKSEAVIESQKVEKNEPKKAQTRQDIMMKIMDNRLTKQAKKAGVSVTVRTKKR